MDAVSCFAKTQDTPSRSTPFGIHLPHPSMPRPRFVRLSPHSGWAGVRLACHASTLADVHTAQFCLVKTVSLVSSQPPGAEYIAIILGCKTKRIQICHLVLSSLANKRSSPSIPSLTTRTRLSPPHPHEPCLTATSLCLSASRHGSMGSHHPTIMTLTETCSASAANSLASISRNTPWSGKPPKRSPLMFLETLPKPTCSCPPSRRRCQQSG